MGNVIRTVVKWWVDRNTPCSRRVILPTSPICITPDHVLGLVESIYSTGGRLDSEELNDMIDVDLDVLTHAIDVSEAMGLLTFSKGDIILTERGVEIARLTPKHIPSVLREYIKALEPINTIVMEASRYGGEISVEQLEKILLSYYGGITIEIVNCVREWLQLLGIRVRE